MAADHAARRAAERVARLSYGRLVAVLAGRAGNLAAAEDALGDALARALERWPRDGVPASPEAWLTTAARQRLVDRARAAGTASRAEAEILRRIDDLAADGPDWPDERLKLLCACAHPGLAAADRAPLMLQVVLGLPARRIASAFLTAPAAMGQRLSRAKARIASTGMPLEMPGPDEAADRVAAVLDAIYAAYTIGSEGHGQDAGALAQEALWLASLAVRLAPESAEAHGLLALILFVEGRRGAARGPDGGFVPLADQDPRAWDAAMLADAEAALRHAGRMRRPGRFQFEASVQAVHAARRRTHRTDWEAIALLYEGLVALAPTVGALTARAAALGEARGADAGLAALDAIPPGRRESYQPWWAVRAHLLAEQGGRDAAHAAFERASALSADPAVRRHLMGRARAHRDA